MLVRHYRLFIFGNNGAIQEKVPYLSEGLLDRAGQECQLNRTVEFESVAPGAIFFIFSFDLKIRVSTGFLFCNRASCFPCQDSHAMYSGHSSVDMHHESDGVLVPI